MSTESIISKVWSFCTTLRDDGVGYGDYLEQLTYLIFLKMADEYARPPYKRDVGVPEAHNWQSLKDPRLMTCSNDMRKELFCLTQVRTAASLMTPPIS